MSTCLDTKTIISTTDSDHYSQFLEKYYSFKSSLRTLKRPRWEEYAWWQLPRDHEVGVLDLHYIYKRKWPSPVLRVLSRNQSYTVRNEKITYSTDKAVPSVFSYLHSYETIVWNIFKRAIFSFLLYPDHSKTIFVFTFWL